MEIEKFDVDSRVEELIKKRIRDIQDNNKKLIPKNGPLEDGNVVIMDCTTHFVDTREVYTPGTFKRAKMLFGPNAIRPKDMYEAIKKAKPNITTTISFTMSADLGGPENAGRKMQASFIIHAVMTSEDPEIDDDLATAANYPNKDAMISSVTATAKNQVDVAKKNAIRE